MLKKSAYESVMKNTFAHKPKGASERKIHYQIKTSNDFIIQVNYDSCDLLSQNTEIIPILMYLLMFLNC